MADLLQKQGTTVTWQASDGTYVLTLTSLATAAGRKGAGHDFGATFPLRARIALKTLFASAPTAGLPVEVYWSSSHDNTDFDAGTAAGDAAMSDTDLLRQLTFVGVLPADNTTNSQQASWVFDIPARYGYPVVFNASGQALSSTAGDHVLSLTPLIDEV
jgi:hypothetical protein